jgi:hypothetical protein
VFGKTLVMCEEQGRGLQEVVNDIGPEFKSELMSAAMKEIKTEAGGEPINEHADEPALHEKITLKPERNALPDIEKALAEASKLAVVSDFFGGWNAPIISVATGESELKEVLEKIGDNYTYNWDKQSGVIELRDRNWFKKRTAQIPEAWLERWRQEFTTTGTLDIDTLSQMAVLTQEQIKVNLASDDVLNSVIAVIYTSREPLRLYASLSADQRAALFTTHGLDLRSLSQDQWAQAQKSWRTSGDELKRDVSIAATREQKGKVYEYMFSLIGSNGDDLGARAIVTPKYNPPAQKKPASDRKSGDTAKPADPPKPK